MHQCCSCRCDAAGRRPVGPVQPSTESCLANQNETKHNTHRRVMLTGVYNNKSIFGATNVKFGWELKPFKMDPVNHSPARNKKTNTALGCTRQIDKHTRLVVVDCWTYLLVCRQSTTTDQHEIFGGSLMHINVT